MIISSQSEKNADIPTKTDQNLIFIMNDGIIQILTINNMNFIKIL